MNTLANPAVPNVHLDNVPPIPSELVLKTEPYTQYSGNHLVDWHPVRRELFVKRNAGGKPKLHLLRSPSTKAGLYLETPEAIGSVKLSPIEDERLVFLMDRGGDEKDQIYIHAAGGEPRLLSDGKSKFRDPLWSPDGGRLAFASNARTGRDFDLYLHDLSAGTTRCLVECQGGGWGLMDWSPCGRSLLIREFLSVTETKVHQLDVSTGALNEIKLSEKPDLTFYFSNAKYSPDGRFIYGISDFGSEFRGLARLEPGLSGMENLSEEVKWDVMQLEFSPDGNNVYVLINEGGASVIEVFDVKTGGRTRVPGLPEGWIDRICVHPRSGELAFDVTSSRIPGDIYSFDFSRNQLECWIRGDPGKSIVTQNLPKTELIRWKSHDGLELSSFIHRPPLKFEGPRPVIIYLHGGPASQSTHKFLGDDNYYVQELGITILRPNIRGSTGYGRRFMTLDDGLRRGESYQDVGSLLDWIREQPDLDENRVLITGRSYGGHLTLVSSFLYAERIRGAISIVGMSNLVTSLSNTGIYRRDLRRQEYGDERDPVYRKFFEQWAPLYNVDKMRAPMLIVQGRNDPRVPASEAEQMVGVLKKKGIPVWTVIPEDEGHQISDKETARLVFRISAMFVEKFLLASQQNALPANAL
jgi:dipeptidyl aminopeptidase/acylaminoacyl peptidase